MHGELPQELSVTALEVLGTGIGQAEGINTRISCVFKLGDGKVWERELLHLELNPGAYIF